MTASPDLDPTDLDLTGFDLFDAGIQQDPHRWYDAMRADGVHAVDANGLHVVLGYDLVLEVLRDPETYSSRYGSNREPAPAEIADEIAALMATALPIEPTLLDNDPPSHTRYRRLVSRAFTPKMVNQLRPVAEAISDRLVDRMVAGGTVPAPVEFVEAFAVPLPVEVIAHALNVPEERRADFKRWSDDNIAAIGAKLSPQDYLSAQRGIVEMQHFFVDQFEQRRAERTDDLLSDLLDAHISGTDAGATDADSAEGGEDRPLEMHELVRLVQMLLVAGNETTTKFLTETMVHLASIDGAWAHLRAHPELIPNVVEEGLRLASPTQGMYRVVTRDTVLGGVELAAGTKIVAMFAAANRDGARFECPHEFRLDRPNAREQIAFGKGTHYCLGANLSRLEGCVALEVLTRRIADVRIADDNTTEYAPSFLLRGLKSLRLEITPA